MPAVLQAGKEVCSANGTPSVPSDVVCLNTTYTSSTTVSHSRPLGVAAADYGQQLSILLFNAYASITSYVYTSVYDSIMFTLDMSEVIRR